MPTAALIPSAQTRIAPLVTLVDGYPSGTHRLNASTGGQPLEDGSRITDHAVVNEKELTLHGWVGDFRGDGRPAQAWQTIEQLQDDLETLTVVTELLTYNDMFITKAETTPRARGLRFTLELRQIQIQGRLAVASSTGPGASRMAPVQRGRVASAASTGGTPAVTADNAGTQAQALARGLNGVLGDARSGVFGRARLALQRADQVHRNIGDLTRGVETLMRRVGVQPPGILGHLHSGLRPHQELARAYSQAQATGRQAASLRRLAAQGLRGGG